MTDEGHPERTHPAVSQQELKHREDLAGRLATLEAKLELGKRVTKLETSFSFLKWGIVTAISMVAAGGVMLGAVSQLANLIRVLTGATP